MGRGCNPRGQNCRRRFSNASWILEQVGHVLEQGKGREGASWSWSECERVRICSLSRSAYCLLPTACAVLLSAMYVYVCVCAESIHVVKQFYLGPRCVCVWVWGGGGERAEQVAHVSLSEGQLRAFLV